MNAKHPHAHTQNMKNELRLVAWETTRNCNLACVHCRASATMGPHKGELDTPEALRLLDQIAEVGKPIIILTGGEPLLRSDIYDIARYGTDLGMRMVMAVNGTLITEIVAQQLVDAGIQRISVSLDGSSPETHDRFRQVQGAFEGSTQPSPKPIWIKSPKYRNWPSIWVQWPIISFFWYPPDAANSLSIRKLMQPNMKVPLPGSMTRGKKHPCS